MAEECRKEMALAPWFCWSRGNMLENLERMFGEWNVQFGGDLRPAIVEARSPRVDLKDEGDRYVLQADLPGMKKENVTIEISDEYLEISGVNEESKEETSEVTSGRREAEPGSSDECRCRKMPILRR